MRAALTDVQLRAAAVAVGGGESISDVASRLGVAYNSLWRRLRRAELVDDAGDPRGIEVAYSARCPCGDVLRAAQVGEGDTGWLRWSAMARAHAREHGVRDGDVATWAWGLWCLAGERSTSMSIPGAAVRELVQAST